MIIHDYQPLIFNDPASGVEVGGWRVEDWVRVQAEGVDVGRAWGYVAHSLGLA